MFEQRAAKKRSFRRARHPSKCRRRRAGVIALAGESGEHRARKKRRIVSISRVTSLFRTRTPPVVKMNFTQNLFRSPVDRQQPTATRHRSTRANK